MQGILKRKADLIKKKPNDVARKRRGYAGENADINNLTRKGFTRVRAQSTLASGSELQEPALECALSVQGLERLSPTIQGRLNIHAATLSGERANVEQRIVDSQQERSPSITEGYKYEDVFNIHETVFFPATP